MHTLSIWTAALLFLTAAGLQKHDQPGAAAASRIPAAVQQEHQHLHEELAEATRSGGRTGAAANELTRVLNPHFEAEEEYALPPLGTLRELAAGGLVDHADEIVQLSMKLKANLAKMLDEHKAIGAAVDQLSIAAKAEGKTAAEAFAASLRHHAEMEEEVMYPAAILAGEYLKSHAHR